MSLSKETTAALLVGSALTLAVAATWYKSRQKGPPKKWRKVGKLSELWCFPIKSCGVINLESAECTRLGLKHDFLRDRVLMVTGLDYNFKTARTYPKMTLIQPRLDGDDMYLTAPGMNEIKVSLGGLKKDALRAIVWDQPVEVYDCGDEVAEWLSKYILGADSGCRLVYYPTDKSSREIRGKNKVFKTQAKDAGALPDASSYMIMTQTSVADLNTKLPATTTPSCALQFRPNFLIEGDDLKPYEEDDWQWVKIGETIFQVTQPCTRCILTTINPTTGVKDDKLEPLKTLKTYRQVTDPVLRPSTGDSPVLGQHIVLYKEGSVRNGDPVYVGA